ncbi:MAG: DUF4215 domain-containing protein, partial [Deltaproteobacteria bacterium]
GWVNIPPTTDTFGFSLEVQWLDTGTNTIISTQPIKTYTAATDGWDHAVASLVAPAGATRAQVAMVVSSLNATLYVDDFVFAARPICGDGLVEGSEQCDDGNTANGDGCSSICTLESGFSCSGNPSVCTSACGDGFLR